MKRTLAFFLLMMAFFMLSCSVNAADSVNMSMEVYNSNGELIEEKSDLKAGDYNVTVGLLNLDENQKDIEVFVAVKDSGVLKSVSKKVSTINQKPVSKFFEVTIPVTINESGSGISLEAYCWNDGLVPYSEKVVFGEPKYEKFEVYGRITATNRNNSSLSSGDVIFNVEKSDNFDGYKYGVNELPATSFKMKYENSDVHHSMFQYAKATVIKDNYGNYTLTSAKFFSSSIYKYSSSLYVKNSFDGTCIDFYTDTDYWYRDIYNLDDMHTQMYVNGVLVGMVNDETVNAYILNNDCGTVTLIDTTDDSKIDYILVDYYVDAVVDSVYVSKIYRVYFSKMNSYVKNLKIDTTNENISATYKLNGHDISYTDLQKGDVVSIAYDVTDSFENSMFYDMIVSRSTISGKVSAMGVKNDIYYYVINGDSYSAAASMYGYVNAEQLYPGTEYILYLNAFRKFVSYDEDPANKLIGIFDQASINSSDTPKIRIITSAGAKVSYPVKDNSKTRYRELAAYGYTVGQNGNTYSGLYAANSDKKALEERIVEYTVNSSGYITKIIPCTRVKAAIYDMYDSESKSIGNVFLSEVSVIIDLSSDENDSTFTDINSVSAKTIWDLKDKEQYEIYAADWSKSDGTYRFIVITQSPPIYSASTSIAVYKSSGSVYDEEEGATVTTLNIYTNGAGENDDETTSIKVASDYLAPALKVGDVFIYDTDADGYVKEVIPIFRGINNIGYQEFVTGVKDITPTSITDTSSALGGYKKEWGYLTYMPEGWIDTDNSDRNGNVEVLFGVITDKGKSFVDVSQIENGKVNMDMATDYIIAPDVKVYVYDYSESKTTNRLSVGSSASIIKSYIPDSAIDDSSEFDIMENGKYREMNFIFAKLVDGDIAEALVILGNSD